MSDYQIYPGFKSQIISSEEDLNLELLSRNGYFILDGVFQEPELSLTREKIDRIWNIQLANYGDDHLRKIGDHGVVRAMMTEDPYFYSLLINRDILKYVSLTVGDTATLHLQNGIILHPTHPHNQSRYHKDFSKDFVSTKTLSINSLIVIDDFNELTGGTWVVPGSHKACEMPSHQYIKKNELQINAKAGAVIFFDSLLWHKGGVNLSENVRRAINQQYTRPFIKQQLDYPAFLKGKVDVESKLAQVLGFWSIPPKGVEEYRTTDPSLRTYRAGQG